MISNTSDEKLIKINNKLEDVKSTVIQTIDNIMERGEKLEVLVDKTEHLDTEAFRFHKNARKLRNQMVCKKIKTYICITFSVAAFFWLLTSFICGFDYKNC